MQAGESQFQGRQADTYHSSTVPLVLQYSFLALPFFGRASLALFFIIHLRKQTMTERASWVGLWRESFVYLLSWLRSIWYGLQISLVIFGGLEKETQSERNSLPKSRPMKCADSKCDTTWNWLFFSSFHTCCIHSLFSHLNYVNRRFSSPAHSLCWQEVWRWKLNCEVYVGGAISPNHESRKKFSYTYKLNVKVNSFGESVASNPSSRRRRLVLLFAHILLEHSTEHIHQTINDRILCVCSLR